MSKSGQSNLEIREQSLQSKDEKLRSTEVKDLSKFTQIVNSGTKTRAQIS